MLLGHTGCFVVLSLTGNNIAGFVNDNLCVFESGGIHKINNASHGSFRTSKSYNFSLYTTLTVQYTMESAPLVENISRMTLTLVKGGSVVSSSDIAGLKAGNTYNHTTKLTAQTFAPTIQLSYWNVNTHFSSEWSAWIYQVKLS